MPRGKKKSLKNKKSVKTVNRIKESSKSTKNEQFPQIVSQQLKLSESYMSLVLGAVVVLVIALLFFVLIRGSKEEVLNSKVVPSLTPTVSEEKTHVMQEGESLWDLAVKEYGDGFAWTKIVEANKGVITNPDYVPPGTKITIPSAK